MKYLVQLGDTKPDAWQVFCAGSREDAIVQALKHENAIAQRPECAYIALGEARHDNGAPIAVQSFKLNYGESRP